LPGTARKPHSQTAHQLGGIPQILFDIGAVRGNIARMDNEVRALLGDPTGEWRPVVGEMRQVATREVHHYDRLRR
jgi:hypothetical protein